MKNALYLILAVFALVLAAGFATATVCVDTGMPTYVSGYVYDGSHVGVNNSDVTVTCNGHVGTTKSLIDGSYIVEYTNSCDCPWSTAVKVDANKAGVGSGSANGETCAVTSECPVPVALVDVTIPEFGLLGAMIIVLAGVGIIAFKRNN